METDDKTLSLIRAQKYKHKPGYKFPIEKRIEVVTKWLALGNMRLVSELTGVSYQLCRMWKREPWWPELINEVKSSRNAEVNTKLSKLVDRSLEMISDRLHNGDFIWNQKTGEVVRKEVSLRDVNVVAKDLINHQINLEKLKNDEVKVEDQKSIQDQLKLLANEFAKLNGRNTGPVQDAVIVQEIEHDALYEGWEEGLQEGSEGIHLEAGSEEEEGRAECSPSGDGESWQSSQGGW